MHWELDINQKHQDIKITIQAPELTEDISKLKTFIKQLSHTISVKKDSVQIEVDIRTIIYIENLERMTFIYTQSEIYEDSRPLYELEQNLEKFEFVRINKHTLINPRYIESVKVLFNSRYELLMTSEEKLIVTRHYRNTFRELFAKGGLYNA